MNEECILLWDPPINKGTVGRRFAGSAEAEAWAVAHLDPPGWPINRRIVPAKGFDPSGLHLFRLDHDDALEASTVLAQNLRTSIGSCLLAIGVGREGNEQILHVMLVRSVPRHLGPIPSVFRGIQVRVKKTGTPVTR